MQKLSIITINYNNLKGLKNTFKSVFEQTYQDFEYIVIDGGSTDGSKELIEENANKLTYWVSEPDKGIYNAMNKGLMMSNGEYLLFLNSGDTLFNNGILAKTISYFKTKADIYYGNLMFNDNNLFCPHNEISLSTFFYSFIPHPSSFTKRELLITLKFNEDYTIISDWIFFLTCYLKQKKFKYLDIIVTRFEEAGLSSNFNNIKTETDKALIEIFPNVILDLEYINELNYFKYSRIHKTIRKIQKYVAGRK